ncbi:hypothetical protein AAG906_010747 [Vitis piasezkii]
MTMILVEDTSLTTISCGWVRSDGSRPPEPLATCPMTMTCWVAARTSSSSIEYLLARLNKSSIVVGGFWRLDVRLCRAEHKYCPTKASDRARLVGGRGILCIVVYRCQYRAHESSIMHDVIEGSRTHRIVRRGEHVVRLFLDGANGWLVWEVSPSRLFRWVRVNVPHHGGDQGVTMRVHVLHHGGDHRDILILVLASSLPPGLLNADDEEALMLKPGCVTQRFLLLISLSPGGELSVVVRLPTVFFRWFDAIQNYLPLPYQMNGFGKVWPSLLVTESAIYVPTDGANVATSLDQPAKGARTGCPDAPSEGFVSHGGSRAIITLRAADRDRGDGTWAMAGCCDNV